MSRGSVGGATYAARRMTQAALATTLVPSGPEPSSPLQTVPGLPPAATGPAPTPRLEIPGADLAVALALERELGISHPFAQILVRRGLNDPQAARNFLHPTEAQEAGAFSGIDRAVESIVRHVRA